VIHAAHIINMLFTLVLNYSSPHEMLYKTETDFNGLKVFEIFIYRSRSLMKSLKLQQEFLLIMRRNKPRAHNFKSSQEITTGLLFSPISITD